MHLIHASSSIFPHELELNSFEGGGHSTHRAASLRLLYYFKIVKEEETSFFALLGISRVAGDLRQLRLETCQLYVTLHFAAKPRRSDSLLERRRSLLSV